MPVALYSFCGWGPRRSLRVSAVLPNGSLQRTAIAVSVLYAPKGRAHNAGR